MRRYSRLVWQDRFIKFWDVVYKLEIVYVIGIGVYTGWNALEAHAKTVDVDKSLFVKNALGMPLTAPTEKGPIGVIIDNSFTEEQKNYIINAITELDMDLTGVKYEVHLDANAKGKNCVNIVNVPSKNTSDLGVTYVKNRAISDKIIYPITIEIQAEKIKDSVKRKEERFQETLEKHNFSNPDRTYENTYEIGFTHIIKHEMLHTLGLTDIYDSDLMDDTIMYGYFNPDNAMDLTTQDKNVLNTVYKISGDESYQVSVKTSSPKELKIVRTKIEQAQNSNDDEITL